MAGRSRKVFIDLNKDVKKVDKNSLLVLDDADFSAVAARNLIETNENLERYTKWSTTGSTLADADPYFTNIHLLDQYVEFLFQEVLEQDLQGMASKYELELETDRRKALKGHFEAVDGQTGLAPKQMIEDFFESVSFFESWKVEMVNILGDHPRIQPVETETSAAQRRLIRDLHRKHLLSTVVGQKAAFQGVVDAYDDLEGEPQEAWHEALCRLSMMHKIGLLDRGNPLWMELLVRPGKSPGKTMKLTAFAGSVEVISCLIKLESSRSLRLLSPDEAVGTAETKKHYQSALKKLRSALSGGG